MKLLCTLAIVFAMAFASQQPKDPLCLDQDALNKEVEVNLKGLMEKEWALEPSLKTEAKGWLKKPLRIDSSTQKHRYVDRFWENGKWIFVDLVQSTKTAKEAAVVSVFPGDKELTKVANGSKPSYGCASGKDQFWFFNPDEPYGVRVVCVFANL